MFDFLVKLFFVIFLTIIFPPLGLIAAVLYISDAVGKRTDREAEKAKKLKEQQEQESEAGIQH